MNNFKTTDDLIGNLSVKDMLCSMEMLLLEAGKLRARLGEQAHLLDEYLVTLMKTANKTSAYDAVTDGFECISTLREMCRDVIRGEKENMDRPFYRQVDDFIGTNFLDCREVLTKISLYTILLSGNYIETMAERWREKIRSDLPEKYDPARLQEVRDRLCDNLGTEEMDRIDRLFRQSFQIVFPIACWLQGITDSLLGDLLSQDKESGRLNFQLLLDGKA